MNNPTPMPAGKTPSPWSRLWPSWARPPRRPTYFMVLANPVEGREEEFVTWYMSQHIHDLLKIDGVSAAQFFKLADQQYKPGQPHPHRYMVIWEIDSDDLPTVFARIQHGLASGATQRSSSMDGPGSINNSFTPLSRRITKAEARGKSVAEILALATAE